MAPIGADDSIGEVAAVQLLKHELTYLRGSRSDLAAIQPGIVNPVHLDTEIKGLDDLLDAVNSIGVLVGMGEKNIVAVSFGKAGEILDEYLRGTLGHSGTCCLACCLDF
jgi:hypothetical protein